MRLFSIEINAPQMRIDTPTIYPHNDSIGFSGGAFMRKSLAVLPAIVFLFASCDI
ncbi:MAG: hypothetical protein FWB78_12680 [Treponema sp.]|nr:hypothetical protein [Treponema sp.]